jgi:hypothetical protein
MPGIRWTSRGAVALPDTLQVRLSPSHPGRLAVGAPTPGRTMTPAELASNLAWFTEPGPRGRPVRGLVLSGVPDEPEPWVEAVVAARARSVTTVVVHAEGTRAARLQASGLARSVDRWVVVVRSPEDVAALGAGVQAIVPLEEEVLPRVEAIAVALSTAAPARVVFTWPFPTGSGPLPPPVDEARAAIQRGVDALAGVEWQVKGLPACLLRSLGPPVIARSARSANRWYVDADNQRDRALLFHPEVLRLSKVETCRFCELDPRCDGVAEAWLRAGRVPPLAPIRDAGAEAGSAASGPLPT